MSGNDDVIYYNLNIGSANVYNCGDPYDQLGITMEGTAQNTIPILKNPEEYYCSIVRLSFSGFAIPAIQFLVQTPVLDINKGIYSFTLTYGATTSIQSWFMFIPNIKATPPVVGTATQDFQNRYYWLYDYNLLVEIMNNALAAAMADLKTKVGGAIAAAATPFVGFDATTGLFSYYFDKTYFDRTLATPIKVWFNAPTYVMVDGMAYDNYTYNDPDGLDNQFLVSSNHGLNDRTIGGTTYVEMKQQYVSAGYMCSLKSLLVTTNMNVRPEQFNLDLGTNAGATGIQTTGYSNVMTDFLPDISQPTVGIQSYKFIYNAAALYRVFSLLGREPLYKINAALSWTDSYGNTYPLYEEKGQTASIKFMFIKKSAFKFAMLQ